MLWQLSALDAAAKIRNGEITSVELTTSCLDHIRESDGEIEAWAFIDRDLALEQASAMDGLRQKGRPMGRLHGVPVGVKDIFDTVGMPTAWGTRVHTGRMPSADAAVIDRLREAGAIVLGKTATSPLAFASPASTRNPHNTGHSPGGSSAGSAAAVSIGHVPLALGSQTNGSLIRPASYCGVYGFKPTRGMISRRGCLQTSQSLDQVGVMGRTLEDLAVLADVLKGFDPADPASYARPKPQMLKGCRTEPPVEPCFAWFDLPYNDRLSDATRAGLEEVLESLGGRVERLPAPTSFTDILDHHRAVHEYEFLENLENDPAIEPGETDDILKAILKHARTVTDDDYQQALAMLAGAEDYFTAFFNDYDAVIAPAALGEAPKMGGGTGDPVCSTIWTFAGLPSLSLPWLTGNSGLPAGVQLIGSVEEDGRLFRTAAWLERQVLGSSGQDAGA